MSTQISDLARRLAERAEAVCRHCLSNDHRSGNYWPVGDVNNSSGRSLFVRLAGRQSGRNAAGKWIKSVAARIMLRICDWVLSHRRLTAPTQHHASAVREVA